MRRVVVGLDAQQRSMVVADGSPGLMFRFPDGSDPHNVRAERVGDIPDDLAPGQGILAELWMSEEPGLSAARVDLTATRDSWAVECAPGATRFRRSVFTPGRKTAMHTTGTLDYDVVVKGSLTLVLGDGSRTELRAGDVVILPGLAHAWEAGPEGAELSVVMIGMPAE